MRLIDLTGERFGKLVVLARVEAPGKSSSHWQVRCDCGNEKVLSSDKLRGGRRKSCEPCARANIKYDWKITHGHTRGARSSKEFTAWQSMIGRCHRKSNPSYEWYGGAGVEVCAEWRESFQVFIEHIGPAPSKQHTVDRIDVARGYEPGNVRWATALEQANNRTNNHLITHRGKTQTAAEWSREIGDARGDVVSSRIKGLGWTEQEAIDTPYPAVRGTRQRCLGDLSLGESERGAKAFGSSGGGL